MNFVSDDSLRKTREGAIRTATAAAVELERRRLAAAGDGGGEVSAAELEKRQRAAEEEVVGYERHRLEKRQKDRETVLAAIRKEQERADALTAAAKNHMAKNPNAGSPPGARRGRNSDGGRETSMDIPGLLSAEDRAALAEIRKARGAAADPQAAALGAIERIAKRYQDKHGGTFDAAVLEVSKTDPLVGQLHNIYRGREEIEDVEVLLKSLNAIARD